METQNQTQPICPPLELPSHDVLSQLALNDPQAFEALRCDLIKTFIDSSPDRFKSRLFGIQFRIDGIRRLSRTPLGSAVRVYNLMWESFLSLNQAWQDLIQMENESVTLQGSTLGIEKLPSRSAQILEFRRRVPLDHD
jgi:hypothetical protein